MNIKTLKRYKEYFGFLFFVAAVAVAPFFVPILLEHVTAP